MAIAAGRSIAAIPVLLVCARGQRFTFSPAQIGGAIAYAATVALTLQGPLVQDTIRPGTPGYSMIQK